MDAIAHSSNAAANEATHSLVADRQEPQPKRERIRTPGDVYQWVATNPWQRWPMLVFLAGIAVGIILLVVSLDSVKRGYMAAGIAALVVCLFGAYHFKELMALKEQVDSYHLLNQKLRSSNVQLRNEVNRLDQATTELIQSKESLIQCNQQNKQNLKKFANLQSNLQIMGETGGKEMGKLAGIAKEMKEKWEKELQDAQRTIFVTVFEEMEFKEDQEGMTEMEYEQFLNALPATYARHIRKTAPFDKLSGKDKIVDIDEFTKLLDDMDTSQLSLQSNNEQVVVQIASPILPNNKSMKNNFNSASPQSNASHSSEEDPALHTHEHDIHDIR